MLGFQLPRMHHSAASRVANCVLCFVTASHIAGVGHILRSASSAIATLQHPHVLRRRKLPEWVKASFVRTAGFGEAYGRLSRFFQTRTCSSS